MLPNYLTFEMGQTGSGAEGGFLQTLDSGTKMGVYFGRQNVLRSFIEESLRYVEGFDRQPNPIEMVWGEGTQAFSVAVTQFKDQANGLEETTLIGKYGLLGLNYELWGHLHLMSDVIKRFSGESRTIRSVPGLLGGARYKPEHSFWQYFAQIHFVDSEYKTPSRLTRAWDAQVTLGIEHRELRSPEFDWFYGLQIDYTKRDSEANDQDISGYQMPAFLGAEIKVSSYLVVRGSVSQNIVLGEQKRGSNPSTAISSNTKVSVGLGLKHNQATLDGVLVASNTGDLGTNTLLTQASFTYEF
jgi:hypothetical protein